MFKHKKYIYYLAVGLTNLYELMGDLGYRFILFSFKYFLQCFFKVFNIKIQTENNHKDIRIMYQVKI